MANGEVRNEKYMVSRADVSRVPPQTGGVSGTGHAVACEGVSPKEGCLRDRDPAELNHD